MIKKFIKFLTLCFFPDAKFEKDSRVIEEAIEHKLFNNIPMSENIYTQLNILSPSEISEIYSTFKSIGKAYRQHIDEKRQAKEIYEGFLNADNVVIQSEEKIEYVEELKRQYEKIETEFTKREAMCNSIVNKLSQFDGIVELNKKD